MEKQLIIKEKALKQLEKIYSFYSYNVSVEFAETFRIGFFEKVRELLPFYNRYPYFKITKSKNKNYRQVLYKSHIIIYKIKKNEIEIVGIFYSKRNPNKLKP